MEQRGCNLGNVIYPNSTGQFNVPFNPDVERFQQSDPISIRFYDEDPQCGIRNTSIKSTGERCIVGNVYGNSIVKYREESINCNIDGGLILLIPLVLAVVINKLRK